MASLPPFLTRLLRPFTTSSRLSVVPDNGSSAGAVAVLDNAQRCTLAAGCFWGVDHVYRKHFGGKGLLDAQVGYTGGDLSNPTYRAVCGGNTGRTSTLSPGPSASPPLHTAFRIRPPFTSPTLRHFMLAVTKKCPCLSLRRRSPPDSLRP